MTYQKLQIYDPNKSRSSWSDQIAHLGLEPNRD